MGAVGLISSAPKNIYNLYLYIYTYTAAWMQVYYLPWSNQEFCRQVLYIAKLTIILSLLPPSLSFIVRSLWWGAPLFWFPRDWFVSAGYQWLWLSQLLQRVPVVVWALRNRIQSVQHRRLWALSGTLLSRDPLLQRGACCAARFSPSFKKCVTLGSQSAFSSWKPWVYAKIATKL